MVFIRSIVTCKLLILLKSWICNGAHVRSTINFCIFSEWYYACSFKSIWSGDIWGKNYCSMYFYCDCDLNIFLADICGMLFTIGIYPKKDKWGWHSPSFSAGFLPRKRCVSLWLVLTLLVRPPFCTSSSLGRLWPQFLPLVCPITEMANICLQGLLNFTVLLGV